MIITCRKEIPFRWIFFAVLPWGAFSFVNSAAGAAFLFSLKKFLENPAGLTFILSLPSFVSIVTAPVVSFTSDRIWTRFGRRKPFVIASWIGIVATLSLMPLMPNFWSLLAVYMVYSLSNDLNSPLDPLKLEIIPPHERGRATGMMSWFSNIGGIVFYFVALGRFDDVRYMWGVPVFGERAIYWSAALLLLVLLLLITLGIKELDQKSPLRGERVSPLSFVRGVFDPELRPIYLLVFSTAAVNSGLGPLGNLLYTDQWSYTKQQLGINIAVGGFLNIFLIAGLTLFADKLNRMRAYQTLIAASLSINVLYFCYVNYVLPDKRPSLVEIIVFGETGCVIGLLMMMVYVPLVYDYVRRNKLGTYAAGAGMVARLTGLLTLNGVGLFVWGYATLFQPPAGEMARVVLRGETERPALLADLRAASWSRPSDGAALPPDAITANVWQANGTSAVRGRTWEIRCRDKASAALAAKRDELGTRRSLLVSERKRFVDKAEVAGRKGNASGEAAARREAASKAEELGRIEPEIAGLDAELAARSEKFRAQVAQALGSRIIGEGEAIRSAAMGNALMVEFPAQKRAEGAALDGMLADLRRELPGAVDLRPVKRREGYGLVASVAADSGVDPTGLGKKVAEALGRIAAARMPGLLPEGLPAFTFSFEPLLSLEVMTVEDPVETYVSPITRVVNRVLALVHEEPGPRRKLDAIGRSLRVASGIGHVRVEPGPEAKTMRVAAVLPSSSPPSGAAPGDGVERRLSERIGPQAFPGAALQARWFYGQLEEASAAQRITLPRPVLASAYAPLRYDYMGGYVWMFLLSSIGITLTFVFRRIESRGGIRKRGVEEERAS